MPATRTITESRVAALHVTEWAGRGSGAQVVIGLPGLGSTGRSWSAVAEGLPDARFIAPDLRGRGQSARLGGPSGLAQHALDVLQVAEELALDDITIVGHSMGAYLSPLVARELGARVRKIVMIDGGVPPELPFYFTKGFTRLSFKMNLKKLDREWPDVETFLKAGRVSKMLKGREDMMPVVREWARFELTGEPGHLRAGIDPELASADAVDTFFGGVVEPALDALTVPAHVLAATHKLGTTDKPFISSEQLATWTKRQPLITTEVVEANHFTLLFAPEVTRAVGGA